MRKYIYVFFIISLAFIACSEGTIPTAVEPLVELQAKYVTSRPAIDGVLDEAHWEEAASYLVHIGQVDPKTGQIVGGYNVEMKAIWWKEWGYNQVWSEQSYVSVSLRWPDEDKNLDKDFWQYNSTDTTWTRTNTGSDWFLVSWYSDMWYWDAALTNPVGYMEDQFIESFQINDSVDVYQFNVDGLRFLNDIESQNNCWDLNYNDNMTPRDSTDDFPMKIWRNDPNSVAPVLPRVFSAELERQQFLLNEDAEFMVNAYTTPYKSLSEPITVPGYILEDPLNSSGDIMAAGKWENGYWTVELARPCKTADENDMSFNPDSRYTSYYFSLIVGNNSHSPLRERTLDKEAERQILQLDNFVRLTFEFIGAYVAGDGN